MTGLPRLFGWILLTITGAACGDEAGPGNPDLGFSDAGPSDLGVSDLGTSKDGGPWDLDGFQPPVFNQWVEYQPEGATCADGSAYRFYVNFSPLSESVVLYFEGGGACWDYLSCAGRMERTALNLSGIPEDYADQLAEFGGMRFAADVVFPLLSDDQRVSPMDAWNRVFFPYCTGDTFAGGRVVQYDGPDGEQLEIHHTGHLNILSSLELLEPMFEAPPRMLVSGCSAGGTGAAVNYASIRSALGPERGYLWNDSGPLIPNELNESRSRWVQDRIRQTWGVQTLMSSLPDPDRWMSDFGSLDAILAEAYPQDRLTVSLFRMDYNFPIFSYERFFQLVDGNIELLDQGQGLAAPGIDVRTAEGRAAIYRLWWEDVDRLREQFDAHPNLAYFMPFYRTTNTSHCLTLPGAEEFEPLEVANLLFSDPATLAWAGTDMETGDGPVNARDHLNHLLNDAEPLRSHFETEPEGPFIPCSPAEFDLELCAEAVAAED